MIVFVFLLLIMRKMNGVMIRFLNRAMHCILMTGRILIAEFGASQSSSRFIMRGHFLEIILLKFQLTWSQVYLLFNLIKLGSHPIARFLKVANLLLEEIHVVVGEFVDFVLANLLVEER